MTHGTAGMVLTLTIDGTATSYKVTPLFPVGTALRSFSLRKLGGTILYRVWESSYGTRCNCPDHRKDRHRSFGCKHIRVLRTYGMVE